MGCSQCREPKCLLGRMQLSTANTTIRAMQPIKCPVVPAHHLSAGMQCGHSNVCCRCPTQMVARGGVELLQNIHHQLYKLQSPLTAQDLPQKALMHNYSPTAATPARVAGTPAACPATIQHSVQPPPAPHPQPLLETMLSASATKPSPVQAVSLARPTLPALRCASAAFWRTTRSPCVVK